MASLRYDAFNPGNLFRVGDAPGMRISPITGQLMGHKGLDLPAREGTSIPSAADGVVYAAPSTQQIGSDGTGWGYYVVIEHTRDDGSKFYSLYAHLKESSTLKPGDPISAGSPVGHVGQTGGATGPHLHLEILHAPSGGAEVLSQSTPRYDPTTFTAWGGLPHMVGTDSLGYRLISQSTVSGGVVTETWTVLDPTGMVEQSSYTVSTAPILDSTGCTIIGYSVVAHDPTSGTVIRTQTLADGTILSQTQYTGMTATTTFYPSGVQINTDLAAGGIVPVVTITDGSVLSAGVPGSAPVDTGMHYVEFSSPVMTGRVYDNGIAYTQDTG